MNDMEQALMRDAVSDVLREWSYDWAREPFPEAPGEIADRVVAIVRDAITRSTRDCDCGIEDCDGKSQWCTR